MSKKVAIHPQMERVYLAARAASILDKDEGQSALADLLNVAPQLVNNWEARGPSKGGLLAIQAKLGINATWVEFGTQPQFVGAAAQTAQEQVGQYKVQQLDPRVGQLNTMEVDVLLAFRQLGPLQKQKIRIDLLIAAEGAKPLAAPVLAKAGIVAPPASAERVAECLPAPPSGPAPDTMSGDLGSEP